MSEIIKLANLRWDPYFMRRGPEFHRFWKEYLNETKRNILYILGLGFDPRMCIGFKAILNATGEGIRDCLLVEFDEGQNSPSSKYSSLVLKNSRQLESLLLNRGKLFYKKVQMWSANGPGRRRNSSRSALEVISETDFQGYTDIIIDISALPRSIYFPLIGKALYLLDYQLKNKMENILVPNLYIVISEDPVMDTKIRKIGIDDSANYIQGFGRDLEMESTSELSKIWIPILGEGRTTQLERIYEHVEPEEICPILPSPSLDPRRADRLLIEFQEILFSRWSVEMKNISYASEQNPFDVYRQIHRIVRHYDQALALIGGCKVVTSAVSSKLLSIGALLSVYELKTETKISVGIAHVEAQGYEIEVIETGDAELFAIALVGDCYAK